MRHVSHRRIPKVASKGRPLAIDPTAASISPTAPAFIAPPEGSPVYHGFPVLQDVTVEGFTFGKISDFEAEPCREGDAFVVAPDNSRAGLVWEVSQESHFSEVLPFEPDRWGVWDVAFPHPMNTRENVRKNLEFILPALKQKWAEWRTSREA
jgi:hypothetical protein